LKSSLTMVRRNLVLSLLASAAAVTEAARTPKKFVPGSYIVEFEDSEVSWADLRMKART
jgi:hypothetical protein